MNCPGNRLLHFSDNTSLLPACLLYSYCLCTYKCNK